MQRIPVRMIGLGVVLVAAIATIALVTNKSPKETATTPSVDASFIPGMDRGEAAARRFEAHDLEVGDMFPAVEVFDAEGTPFNTASLKGQYTVLVNGCLT